MSNTCTYITLPLPHRDLLIDTEANGWKTQKVHVIALWGEKRKVNGK